MFRGTKALSNTRPSHPNPAQHNLQTNKHNRTRLLPTQRARRRSPMRSITMSFLPPWGCFLGCCSFCLWGRMLGSSFAQLHKHQRANSAHALQNISFLVLRGPNKVFPRRPRHLLPHVCVFGSPRPVFEAVQEAPQLAAASAIASTKARRQGVFLGTLALLFWAKTRGASPLATQTHP